MVDGQSRQIAAGDDAVLWITWPKRGVHAVGHITGEAMPDQGDEFWIDQKDRNRTRDFAPLCFDQDLSANPRSGEDLKSDPRFADATVITFARRANPHRLNDRQWQAIADRLG